MVSSKGGGGAANWELYELKSDPGETKNIAAEHPDVIKEMSAAYDKWWEEVLPCLENEDVVGPAVNPFKELYWKQFGGGPTDPGAAPKQGRKNKKQ
jgi:arylsulfatase